jgi:hypothetical protein
MSVRLMSEVWSCDVKGSEQLLLLALADHGHDDGSHIYPALETVAWKIGLKKRRVRMLVSDLRARGVLVVEQEATRYDPTRYRLDLSKLPRKPPLKDEDQGGNLEHQGGNLATPGRQSGAPQGGNPRSPGRQSGALRAAIAVASEPSTRTIKEPSREPPTQTNSGVVCDEDILDVWNRTTRQDRHASKFLEMIQLRRHEGLIRPDWTRGQWETLVQCNLVHPWWKGVPSPAVLFGSAATFENALERVRAGELHRRQEEGEGYEWSPEQCDYVPVAEADDESMGVAA